MILTIGNSSVYEVDAFHAVFTALKERGHKALLFKQDECLVGETLIFEIRDGCPYYYVLIDGKQYAIEEFSCIWYLHPQLPRQLLKYEPVEYRQFIQRQFYAMREALWSLFRHKKWLDNPWTVQMAENKIYQMQVAARCGFVLPDTVVTSDPERVREFYRRHDGNVITKLLATSPILDKVIYTNLVTPAHIKQIDTVRMSPSIFQTLIPKAYELRITVVGDKLFPVKIFSQEDDETALDWRKKPKLNDFKVRMEETVLPQEIVHRIYTFMKMIGLRFGCIDMIVTPSGEYVFLEINPNGQWYFVQLKTGNKIAEAIADLLV